MAIKIVLYLIIGINIFLQLCILGYIYNLKQDFTSRLEKKKGRRR